MAVANKIATIVCDGFPLGDGEVRRADETLEQPSSPMKPKCMKCTVIAADAPEIWKWQLKIEDSRNEPGPLAIRGFQPRIHREKKPRTTNSRT
jgi:hypothetical protein